MGMLDRLKSLYHKEDLTLPDEPKLDLPEPATPTFPPEPQISRQEPFTTPVEPRETFQNPSVLNSGMERDMQVIIAKLDTLRAQMDNILQRLERIEQKTGEKSETFTKYPWR
ncbi:hypothetical protein HY486_03025 [Candidatus Woesearchaeota archaeon]|nr:hypothetical protein [Candidatus Woesearchaeota archaeon]